MMTLLVTLISSLAAAGLTWLLGRGDRRLAKHVGEIQERNLLLEEENAKLLAIDRFNPRNNLIRVGSSNAYQLFLEMSATSVFTVIQLEYLSEDDVCHAVEPLNISGETNKVPVNSGHLGKINGIYHSGYDGTCIVKLRVTVNLGGHEKQIVIPQKVRGNTPIQFDPRSF